MSKKGCGRKKKNHGRRVGGEMDKGKNPYVVLFSKQKECKEVEIKLFCQILNLKQEGDIEDETREKVDL